MAMGNGGVRQERTLAGASQLILSTELSGGGFGLSVAAFRSGRKRVSVAAALIPQRLVCLLS